MSAPPDEPLPLAELEAINPWYVVFPEVPDEPGLWEPVTDLLADDDAVDRLIARSGERLGTDDPAVAASILQQGWAARLTSVWAACVALRGWAPDLGHDALWRRNDYPGGAAPIALIELRRLPPADAWTALYQRNLIPLAEALRRRVRVAHRLLAGNTASAVAASASTLGREQVTPLAELLAQPWINPAEMRGLGHWESLDPPSFRRTTCCLYWRIPGKPKCGDCSLTN